MIKLAKFPLSLQWVFSLAPSTHVHSASVLSRVRQGVVWLHRARGSSKESSSSVALQGRGHRTLGWAGLDLWIFWSELVLDQEGSLWAEVKGTCSSLGGGYEPEVVLQPGLLLWDAGMRKRGPTGGQWGQLMNEDSCSVTHDVGMMVFKKIHNKCFLLRNVLCHWINFPYPILDFKSCYFITYFVKYTFHLPMLAQCVYTT